ncbi:hypothetical protein MKX01_018631 [Papaver californicum]|nr:hypothetical protein MKX01_018631 [Papaver californicum]
MASGRGITGNKGRCYDFWTDLSEWMSSCREPKDCALLREEFYRTWIRETKQGLESDDYADELQREV